MYSIKLLGPGQAFYDGRAINGFPGQQHCLLFYYLLLHRQIPHTREQVASVFWGDDPATVARKNLRNSLWRLSQSFQSVGATLEDLFTVQEDYIAFTGTDLYRMDIDDFETAARYNLNSTNQVLTSDDVSLLEAAADLYKGDLLEGVYEDWCLYERERLRLALLNILIRLVDHHSRAGSYERGLDYAQRILLLDPTRERVHRQVMMIHWLAGDRDAAILHYRSCTKILQTELSIKPARETQDLYHAILHGAAFPDLQRLHPLAVSHESTPVPTGSPIEEMLQKLHFLEMIVEQANTEMHLLKRIIYRVLDVK